MHRSLLNPGSSGRFLMPSRAFSPQMGRNYPEHHRGKDPGYSKVVTSSEECTICVTHGNQNNVFYTDKENAKICDVIKVKEDKLPRECVFIACQNVQQAVSGWKGNHGLQYHLYLIPKDVDLIDVVPFTYGYLMQNEVQNKQEPFLGYVDPFHRSDK